MLFEASYEERTIYKFGQYVKLNRSELCTSTRELMDIFGWSNTKVCKFLDRLEEKKAVIKKCDKKKTVLIIANYDSYQETQDTKKTQKRHKKDTDYPIIRNKEIKEEYIYVYEKLKFEKLLKLEQPLTQKELERLEAEYSKELILDVLEDMENHKELLKKYVSANRTLRKWIKRRLPENGKSNEPIPDYFKTLKIGQKFIDNNQTYQKTGETTCKLDVFNSKDIDIRSLTCTQ